MLSNNEKYMISMLCYELYKVDWKQSHMITAKREMDAIKGYYESLKDMDESEYTYDNYLEEFGYGGELYACYEEFFENEYEDESYICNLLNDEELITLYKKALEK